MKHESNKNEKILKILEQKLNLTESHLNDTISHKNEEIAMLQNEILSLSAQAEEVRTKVDALKKLEAELRGLTEDTEINEAVSISASYDFISSDQQSVGGDWLPVTNEDMQTLAKEAATEFATLADEMDVLKNRMIDTKEAVVSYQYILDHTPSGYPVHSQKVTSPFGYRYDPFNKKLSNHTGIDFAATYGSTVMATANGTVTHVGFDYVRGNNIVIDHGIGIQTHYFHLSNFSVKEGQQVSRFDPIGNVGSTGRSTGPHLHYEVVKDGQLIDPEPYLNTRP